jgi:hypothetical protein
MAEDYLQNTPLVSTMKFVTKRIASLRQIIIKVKYRRKFGRYYRTDNITGLTILQD